MCALEQNEIVQAAAEKQREKKESKELHEYLSPKRILIVDAHAASRMGFARALIEMGAKTTHIETAHNWRDAQEAIQKSRPQVVLTDYNVGLDYGIDLVEVLRGVYPKAKDTLFILGTANSSQAAVARAAEEDVDLYVLKPYTLTSFRASVLEAIRQKTRPNEYSALIEQGRHHLEKNEAQEAIKIFEDAFQRSEKPSLAYFYHGEAHKVQQAIDNAQQSYLKGLEYNREHYKCLVGLYDALMAQNKRNDAYQVLKRITRFYPCNAARLNSVLKLAVITQNYDDIENYYEHFLGVDRKNEDLTKHVCAALIVCGRYQLGIRAVERGTKLLHNAAIAAQGRAKFLTEIIYSFIHANLPEEADKVLKRFTAEDQLTGEYQGLDLLILFKHGNHARTLMKGRDLIREGAEHPLIYKVLIEVSIVVGFTDAADSLAHSAAKTWPERRDEFLKLLPAA